MQLPCHSFLFIPKIIATLRMFYLVRILLYCMYLEAPNPGSMGDNVVAPYGGINKIVELDSANMDSKVE